MKILEIIPQLSSGGGERFVVDLCNELSKEHDVTLMVLHSLDKVDFYLKEVSNNVRVVSMNKRMGLDIGLLFRVYRYIRREKPVFIIGGLHPLPFPPNHYIASENIMEWMLL